MDFLFYIGIILLPFENFFFAPSSGWAALSPIVFLLYFLFNVKYINRLLFKYKKLIVVIVWVFIVTLINLAFTDRYYSVAVVRAISTLISLGLGISSLFSFDIFLLQKKHDIEKIEKILLVVYSIALLTGLIQYFSIKFNIDFIRQLDSFLAKRSYLGVNRVQFTFTEPSFIGMHLFGILFPIYVYGKNKKIRNLIIIFALTSIIIGSGVRIIVDIVVICVIIGFYKLDFRKAKTVALVIMCSVVLLGGGIYIYENNYRVHQIVDQGIYADGSLAARYFRINASVIGYGEDFSHALFGYGFGQEIIPIKAGYDQARNDYRSSYLREVLALENAEQTSEESTSYCFYTRIISEAGIISAAFLLISVLVSLKKVKNKEWRTVIVAAMYLYVQFESYAFYTVWLVMVLTQKSLKEHVNEINVVKEGSCVFSIKTPDLY